METKSNPSQCRKVIGKSVTCFNGRYQEEWTMVIESVDAKRRSVRSTTGGVYDYSEFSIVRVNN